MSSEKSRDRWRVRMRDERRCANCGKQDERTLAGRYHCVECSVKVNAKNKEWLAKRPDVAESWNANKREYEAKLKSLHLCVACKQQDAYTLAGRSRCYECAKKSLARAKNYNETHAQQISDRKHKLYMERKENGICTRCGRELPKWDKHVTCGICRGKAREWQRVRNEARQDYFRRGTPGTCWICMAPVMEGKKVCKNCLETRLMPRLQNAWQVSKNNHPWHSGGKHGDNITRSASP